MNQNLKYFICGVILLGGGLYLGRMIGKEEIYKETGELIASSHFAGTSTNLNMHVNLLKILHANDIKTASDKLESLVDAHLIALSQYSGPKTPCKNDICKSIEKAKEYREKHPVTHRSKDVIDAINKAFDLVR